MDKRRVLIVGAGASGLMAAVMAARAGAAVTLLEQNERPGKKVCATGGGRCNLTNLTMPPDAYRGTHPEFVRNVFRQFSVADTLNFFRETGLVVTEREGYVYPANMQAKCVPELLMMEASHLRVKIKTREKVTKVCYEKGLWKVLTETWRYEGDSLILANGSKASAISGSDGSGYELVASLGHRIIKPLPALTGLRCKGGKFAAWAGVRVQGRVTLFVDEHVEATACGELQLTDYGVSGIPVFQVSRYGIRSLDAGKKVRLSLNFLPEYDKAGMEGLLEQRRAACPYKNERELLIGLFPEKLIRVLTSGGQLAGRITDYSLEVKDGLTFDQAQVCSGGVDTAEIDDNTLESRLWPGLYFAGELMDIDGTCGGYNLQWAWSSGAAAGRHAASGTEGKPK